MNNTNDTNTKYEIVKRVSMLTLISNLLLAVAKFIIGTLGHSTALVADAVHSISDCLTNIAVIIGVKISHKPKDETHPYGHGKVETLAATFTGLIFIGIAILIFYEGAQKVLLYYHGGELETPSILTLIMAIISVVIKEWMYHHTVKQNKSIQSNALNVIALDNRSDALFSMGTVLGVGGSILLGSKWVVLDPATAVIFSLLIIKMGIDVIHKSINELMEASLDSEIHQCIVDALDAGEGVLGYHDLKTRKIGNVVAVDVHIEVNKSLSIVDAHDIATQLEIKLQEVCGKDAHFAIHTEPYPDPDRLIVA